MHQFSLLKRKRFLPLFCTQFLGALNDNVFKNALLILIVFSLADQIDLDSSILVNFAAGLFILPFFLFSATAGQLADKYDKSMLIRRIKILEISIMLMGALAFHLTSLPLLMLVLFFMGAQSALFGPLKYSILPQHLSQSELVGGNGMIQMGTYLAILLGTIIGGVLIAIKPLGTFYVSLIVVALAISGWLVSHSIPVAPAAAQGFRINQNFVAETYRILRYTRENKTVFWAIIGISWFWFFGATFLSFVPAYTRDVLSGNEQIATLLLTAFSIGIGTGSLLCEKLSGQRINLGLVPLGAVGLTFFAADLAFIHLPEIKSDSQLTASLFFEYLSHWRVLIDLCCLGAFGGLFIVPLYALIQQRSDPQYRARVIAANNIINALFMVLSAVTMIMLRTRGFAIPDIFLIVAMLNLLTISILLRQAPELLSHLVKMVRRCR